jgi:tetratricopeptide (TPR) repeat protein
VNLGAIYGAAGRTDEAAKLWERALAANPAIEQAALNLSQIRPVGEARRILNQYLELNPASPAARARLATLNRP